MSWEYVEHSGHPWSRQPENDADRNVDAIACDDCGSWVGHGIFDGDYGQPVGRFRDYWHWQGPGGQHLRLCEDCVTDEAYEAARKEAAG